MIKDFFYNILQRRHFWRDATFGEVADLYASRTLRVAAIHIGAGFTSVYLYRSGYSLAFIMSFWALVYLGKALLSPLAGIFVAKIGTARGTLISNLLYIPAMIVLGFMPELGTVAVIFFAIFSGISGTIYEICYFIDFSIVKNPLHAGKEIGFMNILEKATLAASPVIGGFVALTFGIPVTMWVASLLFAFSAIPLFKITRQVEQQRRIVFRGFPWRMAINSMFAKSAEGFDIIATATIWGLFVAIFIFPNEGDDIYVIMGALSSVTILVAIITSITYGKIIDKNKGGNLLRIGVGSNAIVHLLRTFVVTPIDTLGVNVLNEAATTAQNMAFLRGMFDTADISGHRILYLVCIEVMNSLGAAFACLVMTLCVINFDGIGAFRAFFLVAAIVILGVGTARFPIYRK